MKHSHKEKRKILLILLTGVLSFLFIAGCAAAPLDPTPAKISFKNGDILTGKLVNKLGKKASFAHEFAGAIKIDWQGIASLETGNNSKIELKSGDLLLGKFVKTEKGKAKIVTKSSTAEVLLDEVVAINEPPVAWKGKFTAKYSRVRGNTNKDEIGIRFKAEKESKTDRILFKGSYDYADSEYVNITKKSAVKLKYDYKFTPRFYGWGSIMNEYNRIIELNHRSSAGLGIGWKIIEAAKTTLRLEAGAQSTSEDYHLEPVLNTTTLPTPFYEIPDRDDQFGEGSGTLEFEQIFTDNVKFTQLVEFYYPFEFAHSWRAHSESILSIKVSSMLAVELGFILDSDQNVLKGTENNDKEAYIGISLEF